MNMKLQSTLTCPECGNQETENMREESCQFFGNAQLVIMCCDLKKAIVVYSALTEIPPARQNNKSIYYLTLRSLFFSTIFPAR